MLNSKQYPKGLSPSISQKDTAAWKQCRAFCVWMQIPTDLRGSTTPFPFSRSSPGASVKASLQPIKTPPASALSSNTFAQPDNYS